MKRWRKYAAGGFLTLLSGAAIYACKEAEMHLPVNNAGDAPAAVENPAVENRPGGAVITYELPNEKDLLYVLAEYEIRPGVVREAKSSNYINRLEVNGFGTTGEFEVKLYSVGRNEKMSEPVTVSINPLTPPIDEAFKSITLMEGFGGMTVSLENEYKASLMIEVLSPDSLGVLSNLETFYTSSAEVQLPVRGLEPEKRLFGVVLRDRWDNYSDTVFATLTPWFEEFLDKDKFAEMTLPTDYNTPNGGGAQRMSDMWNDDYVSENDFVTVPGHGLPQWFTFDLGVTAKLSRLVLFKRLSDRFLYNSGAVKRWSLYGSNDPNPDGSFDESWIFLMECKSHKPSGLPAGENTNEDLEYASAGEEFMFPEDAPPVRYLRWVTQENWGNVTHVNITEIDVFGQIQ